MHRPSSHKPVSDGSDDELMPKGVPLNISIIEGPIDPRHGGHEIPKEIVLVLDDENTDIRSSQDNKKNHHHATSGTTNTKPDGRSLPTTIKDDNARFVNGLRGAANSTARHTASTTRKQNPHQRHGSRGRALSPRRGSRDNGNHSHHRSLSSIVHHHRPATSPPRSPSPKKHHTVNTMNRSQQQFSAKLMEEPPASPPLVSPRPAGGSRRMSTGAGVCGHHQSQKLTTTTTTTTSHTKAMKRRSSLAHVPSTYGRLKRQSNNCLRISQQTAGVSGNITPSSPIIIMQQRSSIHAATTGSMPALVPTVSNDGRTTPLSCAASPRRASTGRGVEGFVTSSPRPHRHGVGDGTSNMRRERTVSMSEDYFIPSFPTAISPATERRSSAPEQHSRPKSGPHRKTAHSTRPERTTGGASPPRRRCHSVQPTTRRADSPNRQQGNSARSQRSTTEADRFRRNSVGVMPKPSTTPKSPRRSGSNHVTASSLEEEIEQLMQRKRHLPTIPALKAEHSHPATSSPSRRRSRTPVRSITQPRSRTRSRSIQRTRKTQ